MSLNNGNGVKLTSKPRIGINLEDPSYYMEEVPFVDLGKVISHWNSSSGGLYNNGLTLPINVNGYPSGTFPFNHQAMFQINMGSGHPPGYYNVRWLPTGVAVSVDNATPNSFTFLKGTGAVHAQLIRVGSGITYLGITRSGDPFTDNDQIFQEPFLRRCRNYEAIRFMNWLNTNTDRVVTWENRVPSGYYTNSITNGSGAAIEYMIDLCNQAQTDMWFCVHHKATNDYIIKVAELIKGRLKPGLKVYLEHSNEVWNGAFPQFAYSTGVGVGPTGIADTYARAFAWHVARTATAAQIFKASGIDTVSVLGVHVANPGFTNFAVGQGVVISGNIDAFAIGPYLGNTFYNLPHVVSGVKAYGVQWTLGELWRDLYQQRQYLRQWMDNCRTYGKQLVAYEAGQHLAISTAQQSDLALWQAFIDANRHPGMYDIYRAFLQMWHEETDNSLIMLFNSCQHYDQYGNWGLMEYDNQPDAPKYRAVMDHLSYYRGID